MTSYACSEMLRLDDSSGFRMVFAGSKPKMYGDVQKDGTDRTDN